MFFWAIGFFPAIVEGLGLAPTFYALPTVTLMAIPTIQVFIFPILSSSFNADDSGGLTESLSMSGVTSDEAGGSAAPAPLSEVAEPTTL